MRCLEIRGVAAAWAGLILALSASACGEGGGGNQPDGTADDAGQDIDTDGDGAVTDVDEDDAQADGDADLADAEPDAANEDGDGGEDDGTGIDEPPGPIFFLHLSDIHIGSGGFAHPALQYTLDNVLPAFPDVPVFATGDLAEVGNNLETWEEYRGMIDSAGLTPDTYIEAPGNHDSLLDGDLSNYLAYTLAGRAGHGTYGLYHLSTQGQDIRVVVVNTASAGDPVRDGTGYLDSAERDAILGMLDADASEPWATIVLGHHPPGLTGLAILGTDGYLTEILGASAASAYLFGHLHFYLPSWEGDRLMPQASTHGNPGDTPPQDKAGFSLFALDDGPVVKSVPLLGGETDVHVDFPIVLITRPANPSLGVEAVAGETNPWAAPLAPGTPGHLLRVGAFAPDGIESVDFTINGGAPQPMTPTGGCFQAVFETPVAASCTIEVTATAAGRTAVDRVELELAAR